VAFNFHSEFLTILEFRYGYLSLFVSDFKIQKLYFLNLNWMKWLPFEDPIMKRGCIIE
jgi:hypothetical protein